MSATVSPTETQIFTAVRGALGMFGLTALNPALPVEIVRGQVNRVPQPLSPDHIVLWPTQRDPLAWPTEAYADTQIIGSLSASVLTVTVVLVGSPAPGQTIYNASAGCQIVRALEVAPDGTGTYAITPTAPMASQTLYTGTIATTMETEVTIQADIHGPSSAENTARIATLWWKQFGVDALASQGQPIAPLYTSVPRQMPFDNAENQVEERWVVDLCMEVDVTVTTTQQFADQIKVVPVNVGVTYPLGA